LFTTKLVVKELIILNIMLNCFKLKAKWDECSNQILIKYFNSEDTISYYKEMNICFGFYKKYKECLLNNSNANRPV